MVIDEHNIRRFRNLQLKTIVLSLSILIAQISFSQSEGDFRSKSGGAWQSAANWEVFSSGSWVNAAQYPGQIEGAYTVQIQFGHNITISNAGISTNYFSKLIVSGKLTLNGGSTSAVNFIINVSEIYVTPWLTPYATIEFNLKSVLWMPQYAIIRVWTGGLTGSCNNNQEIRLGYNSPITFAYCNGAPGYIFTFEELMAGGGTINAILAASSNEICMVESISLTGSYSGAIANTPTYLWSSTGPSSLNFLSSATIQNPTITPTVAGEYIVRLAVSTVNEGLVYTNVDSVSIIVGKKSDNPTSASASKTTVMLGVSTTLTLNGGGGGYPETIKWYSDENCTVLIGEGNNLVVFPASQTTYYGRYENSSPCSYNTLTASVLVNVIDFANVWDGTIDTDFGKAGNWQGNVVPSNGENIYFSETPLNNCILDRDLIVENIVNGSNKTFDVNNHCLTILKTVDFCGTGKIISQHDNSILIFAGNESQIIEATDFQNQYISNLKIDNVSEVSLSGDFRVRKSFILNQGHFNIGNNKMILNCDVTVIDGTISGGSNSELSIENPQTDVLLPITELSKLEIESLEEVKISNNLKVYQELSLLNGVLDVNNQTLELSGNVINSLGSIDATDSISQVIFSNAVGIVLPQNLFSGYISILKVDGAGITLGENLTVNSQLHFNSGHIITLLDTLILTKYANDVIGANAEKCVHGNLRKVGNTRFVFPVGYEDYFAPIEISDALMSGSDTCWFTASYYHEMPHNYYDSSLHSLDIVRISQMEFWILDRYGQNDVSVTLTYDERSGIITDPSSLTIAQWNGLLWTNAGVVESKSVGDLSSPVLSSFSPFTFASKDYNENTLPVEIVNYKLICDENFPLFTWTTLTESNSDYFEVQAADDDLVWHSLFQINGAGNSNSTRVYNQILTNENESNKYFRLIQYDFDGAFQEYPILINQCQDYYSNLGLSIFPNPFSTEVSIDLSKISFKSGYRIRVYDELTQLVFTQNSTDAVFKWKRETNSGEIAKSGLYFMLVDTKSKTYVIRLMITD